MAKKDRQTEEAVTLAVSGIVEDLTGRRGLSQEWEQIDRTMQEEIKGEWRRIVTEAIGEAL